MLSWRYPRGRLRRRPRTSSCPACCLQVGPRYSSPCCSCSSSAALSLDPLESSPAPPKTLQRAIIHGGVASGGPTRTGTLGTPTFLLPQRVDGRPKSPEKFLPTALTSWKT